MASLGSTAASVPFCTGPSPKLLSGEEAKELVVLSLWSVNGAGTSLMSVLSYLLVEIDQWTIM